MKGGGKDQLVGEVGKNVESDIKCRFPQRGKRPQDQRLRLLARIRVGPDRIWRGVVKAVAMLVVVVVVVAMVVVVVDAFDGYSCYDEGRAL